MSNVKSESLIGLKFGLLRAISVKKEKEQPTKLVCECDCGAITVVRAGNIRSGNSKSCGCVQRLKARQRQFKHGKRHSKVYDTWSRMIDRTHNKNIKNWKDYGGRGITVCDSWKDFRNFYADMGDTPNGKSLDRKNNNLGYSKENCRWASNREQSLNRRTARLMTFKGVTKNLVDWVSYFKIPYSTLWNRLSKRSHELVFSELEQK